MTSIGKAAFRGCSALTSITLSNSLTSINSYTFEDCSSLTSIIIPSSVTSIGEYVFVSMVGKGPKLESIHCKAKTPPSIYYSSFEPRFHIDATLYVPQGSINAYKSIYEWNMFYHIVEE